MLGLVLGVGGGLVLGVGGGGSGKRGTEGREENRSCSERGGCW